MRRGLAMVCACSAMLGVHACSRDAADANRRSPNDGTAAVSSNNSGSVDSVKSIAANVLSAFLQASREESATADALDTLTLCDEGAATPYFPTAILATWTLLPFEMRGDTVVARASIVTVAEQDVDRRGGGFIARQRIRTDVLEWDVYRTPDNRWVVCNGLRFGYIGADSLTMWRPDGASYESARRLADSIGGSR